MLVGKHFCLNYSSSRWRNGLLDFARRYGQSTMFDNGAYGLFRSGRASGDWSGYYEWVEPHLGHPNWAVIPDRIDGSVKEQRELVTEWPFSKSLGAPVWHLGLPIDYLLELADEWPRICFGSSGEYWKIGTPEWKSRMDQAFNALYQTRSEIPWIHGLRMLAQLGNGWPITSADSTNIARNFRTYEACPGCMANAIDMVNSPVKWRPSVRKVARLSAKWAREEFGGAHEL